MLNTEAQITAAACFIFYASMLLMCFSSACSSWVPIEEHHILGLYTLAFFILCVFPYFVVTLIFEITDHGTTPYTVAMIILWIFRWISPHFNCLMGLYHVAGVGIYAKGSDRDIDGVFSTSNAWSVKGGGHSQIYCLYCSTLDLRAACSTHWSRGFSSERRLQQPT